MYPKYGEVYYYIEGGKVLRRQYVVQDIDLQNMMTGNYYETEKKAKLQLQLMKVGGK